MNNMYLLFLLFVTLLMGCKSEPPRRDSLIDAPPLSIQNQSKLNSIDSIMQTLISQKLAPGIALGVEIDSAASIFKSYGLSNVSENKETTVSDQFRIASVTKVFTATAILQLVERGELLLEEPIAKFFPNFPKGDEVTIYHLLSHTSGIPSWYEAKMPDSTPANFPMCASPHKYIQELSNLFYFEPGEKYYYSNSGYVLLGEIIEQVSGDTYERFLDGNIFRPSGMMDTEMEDAGKQHFDWVKGYGYSENDSVRFVNPEIYPMPFSAGGLRSTAPDLLKFMTAFNSGKILSKETRNKMTSYGHLNSGTKTVMANFWFPDDFVMPEIPEGLDEFGYGLGFEIMEKFNTKVVFHVGSISGFQSYLAYIPRSNTTIVMLTNTNSESSGIASKWEDIQKIMVEIE